MNKKVISLLFVVYFLAFVGIMNYPFLSRLINEKIQGNILVDYDAAEAELSEDERLKMLEAAIQYNKELALGLSGGMIGAYEKPDTDSEIYDSLLHIDQEGIMGKIRIPKIEVTLPIYHGTEDEVLQKGAGHLEGSSLPVGGESTHACISAHRGLPTKKMFTYLDLLKKGDIFFCDVLEETRAYEVYETEVRLPEQIESLEIKKGEDLVTLITCTPYGINSHRIYVHGRRIPFEESLERDKPNKVASKEYWINRWWVVLTIVLLQWMVVVLYWFNRSPKKI